MEEISTEDLSPAELKELLKGKKGHKYGAKKTEVDGFLFDSKRESEFYAELKVRERIGEIWALELQPRFPCVVNGVLICTYIADFLYMETTLEPLENGKKLVVDRKVLVDVKGVKTPIYRIKKKLVSALFNITITEVT